MRSDEARSLAQGLDELRAAFRVEVRDDDDRAALVQRPRRRRSQARGAAHDEGAAAVDPHGSAA